MKAGIRIRKTILPVVLLGLLLGCNNKAIPLCDFDMIRHDAIASNRPAAVVASGLDVYNLRKQPAILRMVRKYSDLQFYCCDISLPQNLYVSYMDGCDSFPAILFIDRYGHISSGISIQEDLVIPSSICPNTYNSTISDLHVSISTRDTCSAYKNIQILDSLQCRSTYFYYLASRIINDDKIRTMYRDSLISKADLTDKRDVYLLSNLPPIDKGDAQILLYESSVNLGNIPIGESRDVSIPFKNIGAQPLIVYDCVTSCSCIRAILPSGRTAPGEVGEIKISFKASDVPSEVEQTILIFSNSQNISIITVKANVIMP